MLNSVRCSVCCLFHSHLLLKLFVCILKLTCSLSVPFTHLPYRYAHVTTSLSGWGFLMLFWSAVPFCISGALQHLGVNFSFKRGCSIYVNGLLGLIVCCAVQRQFFMRRLGESLSEHQTPTQLHIQTNTHRHAVRLTIKSVYSEACGSY